MPGTRLVGKQIYGLEKLALKLRIGFGSDMRNVGLKEKLVFGSIFDENKVTRVNDKYYINTFIPYYPSKAYSRFLKNILSLGAGARIPNVANIAVTARCICKCWHCSYADRLEHLNSDGLTITQIKETVSRLLELGTAVIGFTGGEPLLRKDLEEIISCVGDRAMPLMFTTGYKLTAERVRSLKDAGLGIPVISLDHYVAEKHDRGRGVKGMFDYALKAIELFQSEGMYVAISFVPNHELMSNMDEVKKCLDFFKQLGINDMRLTSPILSGKLRQRAGEALTEEDVKNVFAVQKMLVKTKGYPGCFSYDYFESGDFYGCGAGYNFMFIDSDGNVCPCDFTGMSFGNIKTDKLEDIWKKMSSCFCIPGCECYASKISPLTSEKPSEELPLSLEESLTLHEMCASYDRENIPRFFEKMGLGKK